MSEKSQCKIENPVKNAIQSRFRCSFQSNYLNTKTDSYKFCVIIFTANWTLLTIKQIFLMNKNYTNHLESYFHTNRAISSPLLEISFSSKTFKTTLRSLKDNHQPQSLGTVKEVAHWSFSGTNVFMREWEVLSLELLIIKIHLMRSITYFRTRY